MISAAPAGGHLSSASIYPACFAPYQFVTACSDGEIRFWSCSVSCVKEDLQETSVCSVTSYEFTMDDGGDATSHPRMHIKKEHQLQDLHYNWAEWVRPSSVDDEASSVSIKGERRKKKKHIVIKLAHVSKEKGFVRIARCLVYF